MNQNDNSCTTDLKEWATWAASSADASLIPASADDVNKSFGAFFGGFLWGLPGVFLSVPLLVVQRRVFASFDATFPLAVVLGENPYREADDCQPLQEDQPIAELAQRKAFRFDVTNVPTMGYNPLAQGRQSRTLGSRSAYHDESQPVYSNGRLVACRNAFRRRCC